MSCPLCSEKKHILVHEYDTSDLAERWKATYGFSPFEDFPGTPTLNKIQCPECGLVYYDPAYFGDGKFYERMSDFPWYYEDNKWEFFRAIEILQQHKPESLLEIGCGAGKFLSRVAPFISKVEGVDFNEDALQACRKKGLSASQTPLEKLTGKYDAVVLFQVLEHVDGPRAFLDNLSNILNDGAIVIIAVPNPDGIFKDKAYDLLNMPPHHNSGWSKRTFQYVADLYDYEIPHLEDEPLRYVHYVSYLGEMSRALAELEGMSVKKKIESKVNRLALKALAPFYFVEAKERLPGLAHLVVFKKQGG